MKREEDKSAYPPLDESIEEKRGAARGLRLDRVEATVHIDVDLLHPLREALELHKATYTSLEAVNTHRISWGVEPKREGANALTTKRLRLDEEVLRHFTAAYDGVAMAAAVEVGRGGGYKEEGGREALGGGGFKRRGGGAA
jgi:uncharacterized protein (DUF4415 family)